MWQLVLHTRKSAFTADTVSHVVQEQMRLEALMKEEAQLTFKPSVNQYHDVRAQLSLRHPEAYLARLDAKRQAQLAQRLEERRTREVGLPALLLPTGYIFPILVQPLLLCPVPE